MHDEQQRLQESSDLANLLAHYAKLGLEDREAWQDRVMDLESLNARELSKLYGELMAYGWLEQNTGATPSLKEGLVMSCYRITRLGLRTFREQKEALISSEG